MNMNQSKEALEEAIKDATENLARKEEARESAETQLGVATRALKEAAQARDQAEAEVQSAQLRLDRLRPLEPPALRLLHLASKGTGYRYKHFSSKLRRTGENPIPTETHRTAHKLRVLGFVHMECTGLFYAEPLITITALGREKLAAEQASKPTKRPRKRAAP